MQLQWLGVYQGVVRSATNEGTKRQGNDQSTMYLGQSLKEILTLPTNILFLGVAHHQILWILLWCTCISIPSWLFLILIWKHLLQQWLQNLIIHTQGSVSCGPRSQRTTPMSILTGKTVMQFSSIHNFLLLVQKCCCGDALHCQYPICQISTKSHQVFPRYKLSKIGLVSLFSFFFLLFVKEWKLLEKGYPIPLKFGTQKGGIRVHLGTKFG